jgi:PTH1 family peptidyl-tRNA hydrolase
VPGTPLAAVVGLGNPGAEYAHTRHNAGFRFADHLVRARGGSFRSEPRFSGLCARSRLGDREVWVLKPTTFMNLSGTSVQALAHFYKLPASEVLVVHDELDLPAGTLRLKQGGGHGGHNGLRSVHEHLGPDYLRLRVGIGHPGHKDRVLTYVLGKAPAAEEALIETGFDAALSALDTLVTLGWARATAQLHASVPDERPGT